MSALQTVWFVIGLLMGLISKVKSIAADWLAADKSSPKKLYDATEASIMTLALEIMIVLIVIGSLIGTAITSIHNTCTSGWSTAEIAVFGLITVFAILALAMAIINKAKQQME